MKLQCVIDLNKSDLDGFLSGSESLVLKVVVNRPPDEDRKVVVTPQKVTEYLRGCDSSSFKVILDYFHERYPNEEVWPPGTILPEGLTYLYLEGGTLPPDTVLPEGLEYLNLGGGTLPSGTVLPEGLKHLFLEGGTLPPGIILPKGLTHLYLRCGTLPPGTILPEGLRWLYLEGGTLPSDIEIPSKTRVI